MNPEDFANALKDQEQYESAMKWLFFVIFGIASASWCADLVGGWVPGWPRVAIVGAFLFGGWLGSMLWKLWMALIGFGVIAVFGWWVLRIFTG